MYRLCCFLIFLIVAACSKDEQSSSACYTLAERQCAMDPFNSYYKDIMNLEDREKAISAYFKDQSITVLHLKSNTPYTGAVCLACVCPNGYSYQLTVVSSDTIKLKSLGLMLTNADCAL